MERRTSKSKHNGTEPVETNSNTSATTPIIVRSTPRSSSFSRPRPSAPTCLPHDLLPILHSEGNHRNRPIPCVDWINLDGLVDVALQKMRKSGCERVTELGIGSHNSLYRISFTDGTSIAASISHCPAAFFSASAKASEIATMQYLRSSRHYHLPIPEVHAWDLSFTNAVGAPYVLREAVEGTNISEGGAFYGLSMGKKLKVVRELAKVQAELSKPIPSDLMVKDGKHIGCIYSRHGAKGENEFYIGPRWAPPGGDSLGEDLGPYSTLQELWAAKLDRETLTALSTLCTLPSAAALPSALPSSTANPTSLGELLQLLSALTAFFTPPSALQIPCIQHSDLALRNVLFDTTTWKITGVIDWEFAAVVPRVLTGRFPNDLGWEGNELARALGRGENLGGEVWGQHYWDWTSLEGLGCDLPSPPDSPACEPPCDYLTSPGSRTGSSSGSLEPGSFNIPFRGAHPTPSPPLPPPPTAATSPTTIRSRASHLISLFYLRKYYAAQVGAASGDLEVGTLFMDAVAYVKMNEVICGGREMWFKAGSWVRGVYDGLRAAGDEEKARVKSGQAVLRIGEDFGDGIGEGRVKVELRCSG